MIKRCLGGGKQWRQVLVKEKGEEGCAGRESLQTAKHAGLP